MESLHKHHREKEQRAAVDLKHHIDAAQAEVADRAEVHQTRARQQAEMHARDFNALLESGQNPYAVSTVQFFCMSAPHATLAEEEKKIHTSFCQPTRLVTCNAAHLSKLRHNITHKAYHRSFTAADLSKLKSWKLANQHDTHCATCLTLAPLLEASLHATTATCKTPA